MRPFFICLALCLAFGSRGVAETAPTPAAASTPGPYFLHLNGAFNLYTHLGAAGTKPASDLTPATRATIYEQVGFGYFLLKNLRLQLTLQFGEALSGVAAGASPFVLAGAIPWAVFVQQQFWIGAGPFLAGRSSGITHFDAGVFAATGYAFPIGNGFAIAPCLQALSLLYQRFSIGLTAAVSLSYRF